MKGMKRILSAFLAVVMAVGLLPTSVLAAEVNDPGYAEITDGYLSVKVSKDNGGFLIDTVEGNQLKKSDNNKFLLYPDESFDTSYTSFRVTRGGKVKDYIFGRDYGFMGMASSDVTLTGDDSSITAVWSVDDLTFTQTLTLLENTANQHGMAYITYQVENAGEAADVQARVMLDTALGYQDYAVYELTQSSGEYHTVKHEQIVEGTGYVSSFFGYDSEYTPSVMAYNVNATVNDVPVVPTKVAFGHWNNLASTVFDFVPNESLYFTNQSNSYLTADSAYALYYDMGTAARGGKGEAIGTYYGVYSNAFVNTEDKVALNFEMPSALQLNENADGYLSLRGEGEEGTFGMNIKVTNISAENIETVAVAVYPEDGLVSYGTDGAQNSTVTYSDPYYVTVEDLVPGEERQVTIPFAAEIRGETQYRKIAVRCFDIHGTNLQLLEEKVLGERDGYVLCPGAAGETLSFTSATPETIYISGTRSLYLTGTNFDFLRDLTTYDVRLRSMAGRPDVTVPAQNIFVDTQANTAELVLDQELEEGTWQVIFDWKDPSKLDSTGEALRFSVSSSPTFKNTVYGVLAIEKTSGMDNEFQLYAYETEEEYQSAFANTDSMDLNLLEFRGSFSLTYDGETIVGAKATAVEGGDSINISDCLDVDNGWVEITVEDPGTEEQSILVDIDGEVYTTGARTKVWDGACALSAIENGTLLSKYNNIGNHLNTTADTAEANTNKIMLWWPGAASGAQTLAGMVMEFRYAEFGRMYTEYGGGDIPSGDSKYVIAFGAEVSPDFLVPNTYVADKTAEKLTQPSYEQCALAGVPYRPFEIRDLNERHRAEIQKLKSSTGGGLSLAVHDILFGGGFIGFNTTVDVSLPSYMDGMPGLEGSLNMKVMGSEWAMKVSGHADFIVFEMEGELGLRSYNSIPVPDKLYFFLGGVTPGVNVDGMGVFWIRGAGGGVDKIYDTIFTASTLPPLTLMLTGEVALFGVLSARGDLSLSARGFSAGISNLKVAEINLVDYLGTELYWYPRIKFGASIQLSVLDIIYGNGSLLLQEMENGSFFWEGFANAGVQVPGWVPALGGMNIGSVDLGVNQERLWGALHVLKLDAGVTYYWGADVEFALGKYDSPEPTIQPFALMRAPVYTDAASGETLYMLLAADSAGLTETVIEYNPAMTEATFTLDASQAGKEDALINVTFPASTMKEAQSIFAVTCGEQAYPLVWMDQTKAADDATNVDANALMNFDAESKTASVTFSVTEAEYFGKAMKVTTPGAAQMTIYGMPRLPELESIFVSDGTATLTGDVDALDQLTIYADDGSESKFVLYEGAPGTSVALTYPANMPSGNYTIRAVGTTAGQTSNPIVEQENVSYTNPNAPQKPTASAVLGGDYTIDVSVSAPGEFDGYLVTIYGADGEPTIYQNMQMDKANVLTVGGQYTTNTEAYTEPGADEPMVEGKAITFGLMAGESYTVGVRTYKELSDGNILPSGEAKTGTLNMVEAKKPVVSMSVSDKKTVDGMDYVAFGDVTIGVTADMALSNCTYSVDGGDFASCSGSSIALTGLADGGHKITLRGENAQGDSFESMYVFTVRTAEPMLMLSSPKPGSFYDGSVTVSGITDPNGTVHIKLDGTMATVIADESGRFEKVLSTNAAVAYQDLTVYAENFLGITGRKITMSLTNRMLGDTDLRTVILLDGEEITGVSAEDNGKQMKLAFKIGEHYISINPASAMGSRIVWDVVMVDGEAAVDDDGVLSGITDTSHGMVRGQLELCSAGAVIGGQRDLLGQMLVMEKTVTRTCGDEPFELKATGAVEGSVVTYASSDPAVAVVDPVTGMVTVVGPGTTQIIATASAVGDYQQTSVSCELTVNPVPQNLTFAQSAITKIESAVPFTQAVQGAMTTVTYVSDNTDVAEVNASTGEVAVKGIGTATITATAAAEGIYAAASASYVLTVNAKGAQSISFGTDKVEKTYGDEPFILAVTGAVGTVTYTSSDETVASIDANGKVTIHKVGTVIITATAESTGEYAETSATVELVVKQAQSGGTGGGGYVPVSYTITTEDAVNGTVKTDKTRVSSGTTVTLTVTPDIGYTLETLTVTTSSGKEIALTGKGDGKYTFKMPSGAVTVKATFMEDNTMLNFFVDVPAGAYYYDAVLWAAKSGITSGTSATTFSPNNPCTRAQMATFLWRAAGSPDPVGESNPFTDVREDAYYAKAVQWAYEQGITGGTSATTFSPDQTCTRGQMATFLWRNAGSSAVVSNSEPFTDVPTSAYYAAAVQWAYEEKITGGTSATTFSPNDPCTRAQMVTFLYRYFVK